MNLHALMTFATVAERGGFSAAARELDTTRQAVHRDVIALEDDLGVRLLERTTRKVRLTEAGRRLFEHARVIRDASRAAQESLRSMRAHPAGTLRMATTEAIGSALVPVFARLLREHPEVRIEGLFSGEREDFMGAELDVAIRIGTLADSSLLSKRLGSTRLVCCATPQWVEEFGPLEQLEALSDHPTLHFGVVTRDAAVTWHFVDGQSGRDVVLTPILTSSSALVVREAALAGLGIARLPSVVVGDALRSGHLVELFGRWRPPAKPVHAVYSSRASMNSALAAFLERLEDQLHDAEWLS